MMAETEGKNTADFMETAIKLDKEHDDESPYSTESQINKVVSNIKIYLSLLIQEALSSDQIEEIKNRLMAQLILLDSEELHTYEFDSFLKIYSSWNPTE